MSRVPRVALNLLSVALLLAGLGLAATVIVPQVWGPNLPPQIAGLEEPSPEEALSEDGDPGADPNGEQGPAASGDLPESGEPAAPAAPAEPEEPAAAGSGAGDEARGPEDKSLTVTVPGMSRMEEREIPSTAGDDMEALKDNAAIHLDGTGFPWQEEANVYIAGHRVGYPTTGSFLAFYDLNNLQGGDEVYVTDADGEEYTYEVFRSFVVGPEDVAVTRPEEGRNILTLQTCTLPDYTQRLIVQAEKVA